MNSSLQGPSIGTNLVVGSSVVNWVHGRATAAEEGGLRMTVQATSIPNTVRNLDSSERFVLTVMTKVEISGFSSILTVAGGSLTFEADSRYFSVTQNEQTTTIKLLPFRTLPPGRYTIIVTIADMVMRPACRGKDADRRCGVPYQYQVVNGSKTVFQVAAVKGLAITTLTGNLTNTDRKDLALTFTNYGLETAAQIRLDLSGFEAGTTWKLLPPTPGVLIEDNLLIVTRQVMPQESIKVEVRAAEPIKEGVSVVRYETVVDQPLLPVTYEAFITLRIPGG